MKTIYLVLVTTVSVLVTSAVSCPVQPPCECRHQRNIYTLKMEYVVDCSERNLTLVPSFTGGERVDRIFLNGNRITKLSNQTFINVKTSMIDFSHNGLQIIVGGAFLGLEETLTDLDLSTNRLTLPLPGILRLTALKTLNLAYNINLHKIPDKAFSGLKSLTKLLLNVNMFLTFEPKAFEGIPSLIELWLPSCSLSEVPKEIKILSSLQKLNFDDNSFTKIDANAFSGLSNLKDLELSRNQLSSVDKIDPDAFSGLGSLQRIGFFSNRLNSLPTQAFSHLKNLTKLDFDSNSLSYIGPGDFAGLTSLTQLDVSGNGLHFQPGMFSDISKSLNYILIGSNGLTSLPVSALSEVKSLQWIDAASSNFPKDLPANFAAGLSITKLSLAYMNLTSVRKDTFNGVKTPFDLYIDSNKIRSLDFVTDFCQFRYIYIVDNPIVCDCHVYNITQSSTTTVQGTCASPSPYKGLQIGGQKFNELAKKDCKYVTGPVKCTTNGVKILQNMSAFWVLVLCTVHVGLKLGVFGILTNELM